MRKYRGTVWIHIIYISFCYIVWRTSFFRAFWLLLRKDRWDKAGVVRTPEGSMLVWSQHQSWGGDEDIIDAEGNEDTGSSERHWVSTSTFPLTNTSKIRYKTGTGLCLVLWFLKMRREISLYWKLKTRNSLYWKLETRNSLYRKFETRNSLYQTGNTKQKLCLISSGLMVTISSCIYVFRYTNTNLDLTLKVGGWRSLRLKTYIPQA